MTLLFIRSGYAGIYDYIETSILEAFENNAIPFIIHHPHEPIENLETILKENKLSFAVTILGDYLSIEKINLLKTYSIKIAVWLTEDPFYIDHTKELIDQYDVVLTIDQAALTFYRATGHQHVYHLPLGTNTNIFKPLAVSADYATDLLLVGAPYPSRVHLILFLLQQSDYQITVIGKGWYNALGKKERRNPQLNCINRWIAPQDVATFYNGAKIILNPHRTGQLKYNKNRLGIINESINNRTFDIGACGKFQLIEEKADLFTFFEHDEIVSYQDQHDCLLKIKQFIDDQKNREIMSERLRKKVLAQHTFNHRILTISDIIDNC
ncbi:CgeB family protein [Heyndrickxia ginsengihumi]|uniref:Glycosyltransferase n=1 Tax=Heyndrickxia ginsengihumi TaxID=363870 RepID=A0A6M0P2Q0_9BACI|nr:glycosyltransferase [Heyndrickxia ginsengihumi]MBE6185284.1 protein CgeB [Bacillus sp. (in: firmicutes)]NEY18811.1 glycosyltransferase [Heyndrickxia ginsengihumi]